MADGPLHAPPIGAHTVIGNGRSAALIRPSGEVDWWCAPDLDSPPLLWSLLDPDGGRARWVDVRMVRPESQPAGPVAHQVLQHGRHRLETADALLDTDAGGVALVRLVRSIDAAVELEHELVAGGFDAPWVEWDATSPLTVRGGGARADGPRLRSVFHLQPGEWQALVVVTGDPAGLPIAADELRHHIDDAERAHEAWLEAARLPRHHPDRAADALRVLRACTFEETGAVVAALTTSLPEAPGHDRQYDYRYTWLRDASLAVAVAALLGRRDIAERYLSFVHGAVGDGLGPLTSIRGEAVPEEREVPGVAGWAGSQPVRVGNAAAGQTQHDALGMLVEAVSVYVQTGGSLDRRTWKLVVRVADELAAAPAGRPTHGIWELREPKVLVTADIGRWLALDRAVRLARYLRPWHRRRHWIRARDGARQRVLSVLGDDGLLPQTYDGDQEADAATLMAALFGLLDRDDPRTSRLIDAVLSRLEAGPHVFRYPPGAEDGFAGHEGAFVPMSWWVVSSLAAVGRLDEAQQRAAQLCAGLPRLLSEEVDPESGAALGNVPLLWSHMELARAQYILDAAQIRDRFGATGLWTWRLARYARLKWWR